MLSIGRIRSGGSYWLDLAKEKYFSEGGEPPGYWLGEGAERMKLDGSIQRDELRALLKGFAPRDGETKLVKNAGKERQKGYDLTFSAPKDVSIAWALSGKETRSKIEEAHRRAVGKGIEFLEDYALFSRRGKDGVHFERAKAIIAAFDHCTSRAGDMQLHTHALLANVCYREDGTTGTLYGHVRKDKEGRVIEAENPILDAIKATGAVYRLALAEILMNELGYTIERDEKGFSFNLQGSDDALREHYSTRGKEIEKEMRELGFYSSAAAQIANYETRKERGEKPDVHRAELAERWSDTAETNFGFSKEDAEALRDRSKSIDTQQGLSDVGRDLVDQAAKKLTQDTSSFSVVDLFEQAAVDVVEKGVTYEQLKGQIEKEIFEGDLVSLGYERLQRTLTTKDVLTTEDATIRALSESQKEKGHKVAPEVLYQAIKKLGAEKGLTFNKEYTNALEYLVTGLKQGRDLGATRTLIGDPGSGKTTLLSVAKETFEAAGYRVVGTALAGRAADQLSNKAGIESNTIAKWLYEWKRGPTLSERVLGKSKDFEFDENTVLVIDEASMVDTPKFHDLYQRAVAASSLVIFSGDNKQCQAIGIGGVFSYAIEATDAARITGNFRQEREEDKQLIADFSSGKTREALEQLADNGNLEVLPDKEKMLGDLIESWSKEGVLNPKDNQILVGTHKERLALNHAAQIRRAQHHQNVGFGLKNHEGQTIFRGDRITFHEGLRLRNQHQSFLSFVGGEIAKAINPKLSTGIETVRRGDMGTVLTINPFTKTYSIKMDDGRILYVPQSMRDPKQKNIFGQYKQDLLLLDRRKTVPIALGYAITTHASQGSEFKNTFIAAGGSFQNRELSLVQLSRHTQNMKLFTTETEAGGELTLRSLKAKATDGTAEAEKLDNKLTEAQNDPQQKTTSSLLFRHFDTSQEKQLALAQAMAEELERQELHRKLAEQENARSHRISL